MVVAYLSMSNVNFAIPDFCSLIPNAPSDGRQLSGRVAGLFVGFDFLITEKNPGCPVLALFAGCRVPQVRDPVLGGGWPSLPVGFGPLPRLAGCGKSRFQKAVILTPGFGGWPSL